MEYLIAASVFVGKSIFLASYVTDIPTAEKVLKTVVRTHKANCGLSGNTSIYQINPLPIQRTMDIGI